MRRLARGEEGMIQKATSVIHVLLSVGVGVLLSVVLMALQWALSPQSPIKRVFTVLNWPVTYPIDSIARTFCNGNTDQLIPQFVLLWCIYWLMLGCALGLAGYKMWRYFESG